MKFTLQHPIGTLFFADISCGHLPPTLRHFLHQHPLEPLRHTRLPTRSLRHHTRLLRRHAAPHLHVPKPNPQRPRSSSHPRSQPRGVALLAAPELRGGAAVVVGAGLVRVERKPGLDGGRRFSELGVSGVCHCVGGEEDGGEGKQG